MCLIHSGSDGIHFAKGAIVIGGVGGIGLECDIMIIFIEGM